MTEEIDYNSKSWQQGYWVGRGELRTDNATAEINASFVEGVLMGECERGVNFHSSPEGEYWTDNYTPTLHSLHDLENDLVAREDDE